MRKGNGMRTGWRDGTGCGGNREDIRVIKVNGRSSS